MIDPEELATLFDRHAPALELYVRQWCRDAADVAQSAFVRLAEQPEAPRQPVPWLYRVARNLAITRARAESVRRRHQQRLGAEAVSWFVSSAEQAIDAAEAAAALAELPDDRREVVVLRIWGGLTFDEIAEVLRSSRTTVFRKYTAALASLKQRLESPCNTNPSNRG